MKATTIAPSNIAFIKYWGRKDEELRLPANGSISMNLSNLLTTTTVEFRSSFKQDGVVLNNETLQGNGLKKVSAHLDRVRKLARVSEKAKVVSINNFPPGTGLSSSASGFAALTLAASYALGLTLSEKELSILARQGSGSACRSIPDGFVEWLDGDTSDASYAYSIFPPDYWELVDIVCILTADLKDVPTSEGQKVADTSPFFAARQAKIKEKIAHMKEYIKNRDFKKFGELIEAETIEFHTIMLTSTPSLIYWYPETIFVMKLVKKWRAEGLPVYFTINTGQNIHVICLKKDATRVERLLHEIPEVKQTIRNTPSKGARLSNKHLF